MKRSTILCSLLPVLLVLSLCACSASPSGASDGAETPNNIFHELPLPAVTEGQVSVLDARGSRILYVQVEKLLSKDGGYAYYETKQVGIYDVDAQKSLAVWEPETPGNYFGGALLDGDAAILALQLDYTNAYPAQFAAMYFGGSQRSLVELTGELQWLLPFSGKEALASYRTEEGAFGVLRPDRQLRPVALRRRAAVWLRAELHAGRNDALGLSLWLPLRLSVRLQQPLQPL